MFFGVPNYSYRLGTMTVSRLCWVRNIIFLQSLNLLLCILLLFTFFFWCADSNKNIWNCILCSNASQSQQKIKLEKVIFRLKCKPIWWKEITYFVKLFVWMVLHLFWLIFFFKTVTLGIKALPWDSSPVMFHSSITGTHPGKLRKDSETQKLRLGMVSSG